MEVSRLTGRNCKCSCYMDPTVGKKMWNIQDGFVFGGPSSRAALSTGSTGNVPIPSSTVPRHAASVVNTAAKFCSEGERTFMDSFYQPA